MFYVMFSNNNLETFIENVKRNLKCSNNNNRKCTLFINTKNSPTFSFLPR